MGISSKGSLPMVAARRVCTSVSLLDNHRLLFGSLLLYFFGLDVLVICAYVGSTEGSAFVPYFSLFEG